jgi:hypothetical protein
MADQACYPRSENPEPSTSLRTGSGAPGKRRGADGVLSRVLKSGRGAPGIEIKLPRWSNEDMGTVLRKYTSFDEMKADEYRYWQSRPVHERMDAVEEMIRTAYALKGWEIEPDVPRLQRPFVRLPCPWR